MNLAFYMRLSRADGEDESISIQNQRKVLQDYTDKNLGGREHTEYIDDGFSGSNFDRPAVKKLIRDCRKGLVDTILVKDLSRFGRNYIDVGDYVEHIFPMLGVRFIAIGDHVDITNGKTLELENAMMNLMNTYYVYDCSAKVRSTISSKMEKGQLTSKITPIGYICESMDKGWEVEPVGAWIVKRIFSMALDGMKDAEIAQKLNETNTPTPMQVTGRGNTKAKEEFIQWEDATVRRILNNEAYTGVLVQGKKQVMIPGKHRKQNRAEQFRHEGHHEALVSHEDWEKVQSRKGRNTATVRRSQQKTQNSQKTQKPPKWPLMGKVRCGVCNRKLSRKPNGMLVCNRPGCKVEISESDLNKSVAEAITGMRKVMRRQRPKKIDVAKTEKRIRELKERQTDEYEAYVNGQITADAFRESKQKIRAEIGALEAEAADGKARQKEQSEEQIKSRWFLEKSKGKLNREMAETLIDTVLVGDGIEVRWKE